MKKIALIGLILVFACLLGSCSAVSDALRIPSASYTLPTQTTDAPSGGSPNSPAAEPSNPADLVGKWYSEASALVYEFFANNTVKKYSLTPGYYEYHTLEEGTYTYDGVTLSCKFPSKTTATVYSCSVNANSMNMIASYQNLGFTTTADLPTEHPQYDFPNFDELVKDDPIALDFYFGKTIETDISKESVLENLERSYYQYVEKEDDLIKLMSGTAKLGNLVNIDYEGKLDGVPFDNGAAQGALVVVNDGNRYVDGFATGIAGHTVGETFDVEVTFPEDYHSTDLAGKKVVFTMKLNWIYSINLTDELAQEHGYDTVDAWVDEVYNDQIGALLWSKNEDWKNIEIPKEAYQFFYQYNLDIHHSNAFYYFDNDFDAYLTYLNITLEDLEKSAKEVARRFYVAAQIVDRHELTADEDLLKKLENEFLQDYMNSGYTEAQAKEVLENEGKLEFQALVENTLAQLYFVNNNTFTSETE